MKYLNILFLILINNNLIISMEAERKSLASFFDIDALSPHEDIHTCIAKQHVLSQQWWYVDKDLKHEESITSACFHKDGTKLLIAKSGRCIEWPTPQICLYDVDTGDCIKKIDSAGNSIHRLIFNHAGTKIIEHSRIKDYGGMFKVACYDMSLEREYSFTDEPRSFCCFNKTDTEMLWYKISYGGPYAVGIFDLKTKTIVSSVSFSSLIHSVQFNHDESEIVTAHRDGTWIIWDKEFKTKLLERKHDCQGGSVNFNQAGDELLKYGLGSIVYVLNRDNGDILQELKHLDNVPFVRFNNDGSAICTVISKGSVQIWDCKTGKIIAQLRNDAQSRHWTCDVNSLEWNSTGTKIVAAIGNYARIWARYDGATLPQILLKTLFNLWLRLEKPRKEIDSPEKLLDTVAQLLLCDQDEISKIWKSFPENMRQAIWLSMHNKIQKYGK